MDLYSPDGLPPTSPHVFLKGWVNIFTSIKLNIDLASIEYGKNRDRQTLVNSVYFADRGLICGNIDLASIEYG